MTDRSGSDDADAKVGPVTDRSGSEDPAAAAERRLPGTPDAEGWRRLHPLSPLLRGGVAFIVIVGIVIANFRDRLVQLFFTDPLVGEHQNPEGDVVELFEFLASRGLLFAVLGGIAAVILVIVLLSWIAWRFHTYRVTGEAVESRRGVLFRQHRRAPLARIQSVNLQRPLLARALGLTKIEIVTAGQGGKVDLAYLGHRDAKTVREQILRLAREGREHDSAEAGAPAPGVPAATGYDGSSYGEAGDRLTARAYDFVDFDVDPDAREMGTLVRVPVGRLIASILLGWESVTAVLLVLFAVSWGAIGAFLALTDAGHTVLAVGAGLLFAAVPMVLVMLGLMIAQFNRGFNFTLSSGREAVRIGAGLTSTNTDSIPFGRIHAVEARQPLFWRPFGWWRARITVAGHSVAQAGQNQTQNVVLPVGRIDDVLRVVETLLPGVGDDEAEIAALRDGLVGAGEGYVGAGPRAGWVLWFGRRRAGARIEGTRIITPVAGDASGSDGRGSFPEDEATFRVRRGFLTRSLSIMPIVRAQSVQLRRPLVHRMLGLASLQAHTVLGPVRMEMRGLELSRARELFDELTAAVLRVQGAEAERISEAGPER